MTPEEAIWTRLSEDGTGSPVSGLAALVDDRIYQLKLAQNTDLPAVRVQLIDSIELYHLRGGSRTLRSRIQIDAFARESSDKDPYEEASAVADAIHAALSGKVFTVGSPETLKITGVFRESRQPFYEAAELREVRIVQDYIVWSKSAA